MIQVNPYTVQMSSNEFHGHSDAANEVRNYNPTGFLPSQYEPISPPSSYIHNTTTHTFSIVASAPGIPHSSLSSKPRVAVKSHGGQDASIRIVQQIAIMMGRAVLPHLRNLPPGCSRWAYSLRASTSVRMPFSKRSSKYMNKFFFDCLVKAFQYS